MPREYVKQAHGVHTMRLHENYGQTFFSAVATNAIGELIPEWLFYRY
jgi:hypothetical protein